MKKIFLLAAMIIIPLICYSGRHYVSPSGSDGNPGTFSHPWRTLDYASRQVSPGDTVNVLSGIYYESVRILTGGQEDLPVVFTVPQGEEVTVKAQLDFCFYIPEGVEYVIIEGFKLTRAYGTILAHGGAVRVLGNHNTIRYNHCYDNDVGVFVESFSFDTTEANYHNRVEGNIISDSGEAGIRVKRSDNTTVISNLIYHNGYSIEPAGAITYYGGDSTSVLNNTIWDNAGPAIHNYNGTNQEGTPVATHSVVANNICADFDGSILFGVQSNMAEEPSNLYCFNLWYNGAPGSPVVSWGNDNLWTGGEDLTFDEYLQTIAALNPESGAGSIFADPLFADPLNLDFALLPGSPAIDAGYLDLTALGLDGTTGTSDQGLDTGTPDLGFHHYPGDYTPNPKLIFDKSCLIYPNPAGETVKFDIRFPVSNQPLVPVIIIYNLLGQKVASLQPGYDDPENHFLIEWTPQPYIASGVYFTVVKAPGVRIVDRLVIVK